MGKRSGGHQVALPGQRLANGQFQFSVNGNAGRTHTIQGNTNVTSTNWVTLGTTNPTGASFTFTDTAAGGFPIRFYRVNQ